ncbi:MAG: bifunctional phosphopantothenoylcysteine decarboxylase/phosphopantothenate--cysteine ligase CoaBC [Flavobacteriales bacterium]|nr:bifunctional phosphopantothenoylcysteine decarboxylase/phosphopantothenate--cysteine ligase CoaBC [Flavobacteriales bacterium]
MPLKSKKILLAVTGSIAAYKSAYLVRLLTKAGAEVKVVMTPSANDFITPLTLSGLSGNPVHSDFTENRDQGTWTNHVHLGLWPDLFVVAPASANTLSRMANGACENFMMAVYMSLRVPVMVAPAMDHDMYLHPATLANLEKLSGFGHLIIEPRNGSLASGLLGKGRMAEPEEIFQEILNFFHPDLPLRGKTALVTAGPTHEPIDPVRFIGNRSTGTMGFAIARALADRGAVVQLVTGPVNQHIEHPMVQVHPVETADEMAAKCLSLNEHADIIVLSAAVADYKPLRASDSKIKKQAATLRLELTATTDIAATLGASKKPGQIMVGFALETDNEAENALSKLKRKNLDMIVLNSLRDEGAGFGSDTNKITLFWSDNKKQSFGLKSKTRVAEDIVNEIVKLVQV